MYTIGTAGHVDHGKTLLIEALSGINPDRLPEEKERGMTIDLGFAHFPGKDDEPIGIIDVPGHERFIRNMVAGSWSLDCALLVVAADDGWMQQSGDHLRVLKYMGITSYILVITKTDLVSPERLKEAEEEALLYCNEITGVKPPSIRVSAAAGENIDLLKEKIIEMCIALPEKKDSEPLLYVDRVFSVKGSGTIITGSLTGGPISKSSQCFALPENKPIKIREIQSYYTSVDTARPVSRVAVNIQNFKKEDIQRGSCITTAQSGARTVRECIFRIDSQENSEQRIKNHSEVEIAFGTDHVLGEIHYFDEPGLGRIVFKRPCAVYWNQPFVLIRHGGSDILSGGRFLWTGAARRHERRKIAQIIQSFPRVITEDHKAALFFQLKGFIKKQPFIDPGILSSKKILETGEWFILQDIEEELKNTIVKFSKVSGGVSRKELQDTLGIPKSLVKSILDGLLSKETVRENRGIILYNQRADLQISPMGKNLLKQAKEMGKLGLELNKLKISGAQKELRNLSRLGLVVGLDETIFFTKEHYNECVSGILKDMKPGDRFSIPQAKERTGLSRKYVIPLLNRMESDGYVRRDENERIVLRGF